MRRIVSLVLAAAVLGTGLTPAMAAPPGRSPAVAQAQPLEAYASHRGRYYSGGRYYYHDHGSAGAAAAAGIAGIAAGALIAGAIASQAQAAPPPPPATVDPQLAAYCARKYRSFDPVTGTYLARTGEWIVCTY